MKFEDAHEDFFIVVGVEYREEPFRLEARVKADTGYKRPERPLTVDEMQSVCRAAKMELLKVLKRRKP